MDTTRLVWLFGSSRGGTTWVMEMLGDLPGVVTIDDPHLGHHLGVWRPISLAWATATGAPTLSHLRDIKGDRDSYFFNEKYRDAWAPALRDLIVARFAAQVEASGLADPLVVVKEPGCHVADLLLDLFPESKLIFLTRDGRDVVDSWLAAHQPGSWAIEEGAFAVAEDGRLPLVRWHSEVWAYRMRVMRRVFANHNIGRRVIVRYESALRYPAHELRRICSALAIQPAVEELDAIAARHSYANVPSSEKGASHRVRTASPGGWRRLSALEQAVMHDVMGDELSALGYFD